MMPPGDRDVFRDLLTQLFIWPAVLSILVGFFVVGRQCFYWLRFAYWQKMTLQDALYWMSGHPFLSRTGWLGIDKTVQWCVDNVSLRCGSSSFYQHSGLQVGVGFCMSLADRRGNTEASSLFNGRFRRDVSGTTMVDQSASLLVKRGLHRVGVALATLLGVSTFALGVIIAIDSVNSQYDYFLALRCADKNLSAKSSESEASPPHIANESELDTLPLGSTFIDPNGTKRYYIPPTVPIGKIGCGHSELQTAPRVDVTESRTKPFSYSATLVTYLGIAALLTGLVVLATYFSVMMLSWIVRGFMRA
jgi:hypothetical protein